MRKIVIIEGPQVTGQYIRPGALVPNKDRLPLVWQFEFSPEKQLGFATGFQRENREISFELRFTDFSFRDYLMKHDDWDEIFELSVSVSNLKFEIIPAIDWINDENETHIVHGTIDAVSVILAPVMFNRPL